MYTPVIIAVVVMVLVTSFVLLLRRRAAGSAAPAVARLLRLHGAVRCMEATVFLQRLAAKSSVRDIADAWDRLELPLLESLPDCPPGHKQALATALEDCSKRCSKRDTSKSLMTMRDALLWPPREEYVG